MNVACDYEAPMQMLTTEKYIAPRPCGTREVIFFFFFFKYGSRRPMFTTMTIVNLRSLFDN